MDWVPGGVQHSEIAVAGLGISVGAIEAYHWIRELLFPYLEETSATEQLYHHAVVIILVVLHQSGGGEREGIGLCSDYV